MMRQILRHTRGNERVRSESPPAPQRILTNYGADTIIEPNEERFSGSRRRVEIAVLIAMPSQQSHRGSNYETPSIRRLRFGGENCSGRACSFGDSGQFAIGLTEVSRPWMDDCDYVEFFVSKMR